MPYKSLSRNSILKPINLLAIFMYDNKLLAPNRACYYPGILKIQNKALKWSEAINYLRNPVT